MPAGAQLETFLANPRRGHVEIGVITPQVVGLAVLPERVGHLPHAGAAAAQAARRRLPEERRRLVACDVPALTGGPEHRLAGVVIRVASTPRQLGFCSSQLCAVDIRRMANRQFQIVEYIVQRLTCDARLVSKTKVIAPRAARRYAPADVSSTRGGSTSVRGRVTWLSCKQPVCL